MIELTRLNGHPLFVNCDQIKWAEAAPDTMLTLINGEKVVVLESCAEVVGRVLAFRAQVLRLAAQAQPQELGGAAAESAGNAPAQDERQAESSGAD